MLHLCRSSSTEYNMMCMEKGSDCAFITEYCEAPGVSWPLKSSVADAIVLILAGTPACSRLTPVQISETTITHRCLNYLSHMHASTCVPFKQAPPPPMFGAPSKHCCPFLQITMNAVIVGIPS